MEDPECFRKCTKGMQALMMDWFPCICVCVLQKFQMNVLQQPLELECELPRQKCLQKWHVRWEICPTYSTSVCTQDGALSHLLSDSLWPGAQNTGQAWSRGVHQDQDPTGPNKKAIAKEIFTLVWIEVGQKNGTFPIMYIKTVFKVLFQLFKMYILSCLGHSSVIFK